MIEFFKFVGIGVLAIAVIVAIFTGIILGMVYLSPWLIIFLIFIGTAWAIGWLINEVIITSW
jgi:hypothetical protein